MMRRRAPLTDWQSDLAARYIPMARALARPVKLQWPSLRDELDSAAMMALVEAAQSFDPARNVKFATFARYRIWGAIRDVQRKMYLYGVPDDDEAREMSLTPFSEEYGVVMNTTPDRAIGHEIDYIEYVESLIKKLPKSHQEMFRLVHIVGIGHEAASVILGLSHSRVGYMHREACAMLNGTWAGTFGRAAEAKREGKPGSSAKHGSINTRKEIGLARLEGDAQFPHQTPRLRPSMELAQVVYGHRVGAFGRMRRA